MEWNKVEETRFLLFFVAQSNIKTLQKYWPHQQKCGSGVPSLGFMTWRRVGVAGVGFVMLIGEFIARWFFLLEKS